MRIAGRLACVVGMVRILLMKVQGLREGTLLKLDCKRRSQPDWKREWAAAAPSTTQL